MVARYIPATMSVAQKTVPSSDGLLQANDFSYLGAFVTPRNWEGAGQSFEYSLAGLSYNPSGNGGAGSLLIAANQPYSRISEITIPVIHVWQVA